MGSGKPPLFAGATAAHVEDFPGPCRACLELSLCLLLWRREHSGSAISGRPLFSANAKSDRLLEAHLDGKITLQQVAEACELSVSHFSRAFTKTFHRPPYKWLIERRVDRGRDLMTNSRLPLAANATQCGSGINPRSTRLVLAEFAPQVWQLVKMPASGDRSQIVLESNGCDPQVIVRYWRTGPFQEHE
jgi:AraC-like DNA-binding protein